MLLCQLCVQHCDIPVIPGGLKLTGSPPHSHSSTPLLSTYRLLALLLAVEIFIFVPICQLASRFLKRTGIDLDMWLMTSLMPCEALRVLNPKHRHYYSNGSVDSLLYDSSHIR